MGDHIHRPPINEHCIGIARGHPINLRVPWWHCLQHFALTDSIAPYFRGGKYVNSVRCFHNWNVYPIKNQYIHIRLIPRSMSGTSEATRFILVPFWGVGILLCINFEIPINYIMYADIFIHGLGDLWNISPVQSLAILC